MGNRFFPFQLGRNETSETAVPAYTHPGEVEATQSVEQQIVDAFNANNAIEVYVDSLLRSSLPPITDPPVWYLTFMNSFTDAKTHCYDWSNSLVTRLTGIPRGLSDYAALWSIKTSNIAQAIGILEMNPTDAAAKNLIACSLADLKKSVGDNLAAAQKLELDIHSFGENLQHDATAMKGALESAKSSEQYNAQQVEELTTAIANLNKEINGWNTTIKATAVAGGVSIFVGCCVCIFSLGLGIAIVVFAATATVITEIVGSERIKSLNQKLSEKYDKVKSCNAQIAELQTFQSTLDGIIKLSTAGSDQVKSIDEAWHNLENALNAELQVLSQAQGALDPLQLARLKSDMVAANSDWETVQKFCSLILNIRYKPADPPVSQLWRAPQLTTV